MKIKQLLVDAKKLIEEYGWIQCEFGSPEKGFCLIGAIRYIGFQQPYTTDDYLEALYVLKKLMPTSSPVSVWNDITGRTAEEVLNVLDKAVKLCDE